MQEVATPPESGTFYLLSFESDGGSPPWPFDPYSGVLPVYTMKGFSNNYVVWDTKEDYAALQALNRSLKYGWGGGMMSSMESSGLPDFPPDDEEPGEGGDTNQYFGMVYGSNDLWLEISNVVNDAADFVIHPPVDDEAAAYDLFSTTNLALDVPGLNATNWVWLVRSDVGQTNLTLTSIWPEIGFFRLGTMLDTDSDGLTDALENLVSHSDPASANPDGDELNDYEEYLLGRNPNAAGAVADAGNVIGLAVFTPLQ